MITTCTQTMLCKAPKMPSRSLCRFYHIRTASNTADPAMIRLYRILLRQCRALEHGGGGVATANKKCNQSSSSLSSQRYTPTQPILLQPPLDPHWAGLSRILQSSLSHEVTPVHVLRLFAQWRQQELEQQSAQSADEEYEKISAWLTQWVADGNTMGDTWMDTETLWTTPACIQSAIRLAFRGDTTTDSGSLLELNPMDRRSWAIRAYQYLTAQTEMQRLVRWREESGVRVTTLARCVGKSASPSLSLSMSSNRKTTSNTATTTMEPDLVYKYRFVYRIRIENTTPDRHVQLLGRSWIIQSNITTQPLQSTSTLDSPSSAAASKPSNDTGIKVHAPMGGAVGKHPVLAPGQAFEYMSGCDLATERGLMKGNYYFAWVPEGTPSASLGQTVVALDPSYHDKQFEVPITPFPLEPDQLLV